MRREQTSSMKHGEGRPYDKCLVRKLAWKFVCAWYWSCILVRYHNIVRAVLVFKGGFTDTPIVWKLQSAGSSLVPMCKWEEYGGYSLSFVHGVWRECNAGLYSLWIGMPLLLWEENKHPQWSTEKEDHMTNAWFKNLRGSSNVHGIDLVYWYDKCPNVDGDYVKK